MRFLRYPATTVTISALILRIVYCIVIVFVVGKGPPGGTAHDGYVEIAESLVSGNGYRLSGEPNFFRPPTYVFFLVPWVALPGTHFWILAVQSFLGAATCGMVTRVALRFVRPVMALLSGMALALCPWHVHFTANGMVPVLAAFLTMGLLMWWLADREERRRGRSAAGGALYAVLALCHPGAVLLGPAWIVDRLWTARHTGRWRAGLESAALFAVAAGLVALPWVIRNRVASGEWVVLSNGAGFQYFVADQMIFHTPSPWSLPVSGIHPGLIRAASMLQGAGITPSATLTPFKGVGMVSARFFSDWMRQDLREHPEKLPRRVFQQGWWFWFGDRPSMVALHLLYKGPLLLLAIVGVWKGVRQRAPVAPVVWCVVAFWLVHALVIGYIVLAAYSLVVLGPVCVLAAIGLNRSNGARRDAGVTAA